MDNYKASELEESESVKDLDSCNSSIGMKTTLVITEAKPETRRINIGRNTRTGSIATNW